MSASAAARSERSRGPGANPATSDDVGASTTHVPIVSDACWEPNVPHMDAARRQKPWRTEPRFFTSVSVSLAATVKMFLHGTRGSPDMSQGRFNWFEVMGLLIGHFRDRELVLTDSFSLPVSASEVECSMTEASQIYMANYLEYHRCLGKAEPGCVGWYHTHPGYSCFLSGIDVTTQQGSQRMQDPWVALVIDPVATLRTGQFSMKAFRTYPEGYTPLEDAEDAEATGTVVSNSDGSVPASPSLQNGGSAFGIPPNNRIKDFGMHAHRYYELPVQVVQSSRDAPLWAVLQQHFWPLSLSLSFPFAAATRTCQCDSKKLMGLVGVLDKVMDDVRRDGRTAGSRLPYPESHARGRRSVRQPPLLYCSQDTNKAITAPSTTGSKVTEADSPEEDMSHVERQLLDLAQETLRVKASSFSLITAAQPSHAEVLEAFLAVSSAAKFTLAGKEEALAKRILRQGVGQ